MLVYAAKRLAFWVPSLFLVIITVYALAFFGAGDPIKLIFQRSPGGIIVDPDRLAAIRQSIGLDRPFLEQFFNYIGNALTGNFGNSLLTGRSITGMILTAAPVTIAIGLAAMIFTTIVAVPLGTIAAMRQNSRLDFFIRGASLVFWAVPSYVIGPLLLILMLTIFPGSSISYGWHGIADVRAILPVLVLATQPIALIVRQTRAAAIEVLSEDYVRTGRAKGLPNLRLMWHHIIRPSLTPVVTQIGLILIVLLNGALFVELVFGLPGLGRLTIQSLLNIDYPVILAITIISSVLVMLSNLIVDLIYPVLDPRARRREATR